jgi:hypothetical protein
MCAAGAFGDAQTADWGVLLSLLVVRPLVIKHAGRCGQLEHHPTIFMRWKEQFFINTKESCGLTIAGRHELTSLGA